MKFLKSHRFNSADSWLFTLYTDEKLWSEGPSQPAAVLLHFRYNSKSDKRRPKVGSMHRLKDNKGGFDSPWNTTPNSTYFLDMNDHIALRKVSQ